SDANPGSPPRESDLLQKRSREGVGWVGQIPNATDPRQHTPEKFHAFSGRFGGHVGKACDIAAGTRQARHQADSDRVRNSGHHDWNGCCRLLCSQSAWGEGCHKDIYLRAHELSSQVRQPSRIAVCGTQLEGKVLTLGIAEVSEPEPQFPSQ